ncbi:MAG: hypothetical protein DDT35_00862 [Firmicutes bacterium]|nr:hypothetical protein [Bacillota bacterium]
MQTLDRQRILGPHIDITLICTDREPGDGHGLNDSMRITFKNTAVHECPRVTLIGVTDYVLLVAHGPKSEPPFFASRKARPTPPSQTRSSYGSNHFLWRHGGEHASECFVAIAGNILLNYLRVNNARVTQGNAQLPVKKFHFAIGLHQLAGEGVAIKQALDRPAL